MALKGECSVCKWQTQNGTTIDMTRSRADIKAETGLSKDSIRRHLEHPITVSAVLEESMSQTWDGNKGTGEILSRTRLTRDAILSMYGWDPAEYRIVEPLKENHWGKLDDQYHQYKFETMRVNDEGVFEEEFPLWPVVQPAPAVQIQPLTRTPRATAWKTAIGIADTQIGYRIFEDGTREEFHDEAAMNVALQIITAESPDQLIVLGDIGDFTGQGRWSQEAAFAQTTQPTIDRMGMFAAEIHQAIGDDAKQVWIEGNHDRRLQNFVEANALSAFGLRRAGTPESWPVMSLPNLCRLDEHNVTYVDSYPNATWWVNESLRAIHGTRANSSGSTAAQYANQMPHISTMFGHTHRQEVQSKTTFDRAGKIRTVNFNPGCLCRVDGAVPSVHGSTNARGRSAEVFEDWQQGLSVVRYHEDGRFFVEQVQIEDGFSVWGGQEFTAVVGS